MAKTSDPQGPRWSRLAIVAFLFATLGWLLFLTGPIVGCVLGWIALAQIKRTDGELKGRGMALFAAVQAPLIVLIGSLGGVALLLMDQGQMFLDHPVAVLALAIAVFVGVRLVFWLAGAGGSWRRKPKTTLAVMLGSALLLVGITWALKDGQTNWPFRGTLVQASVDHVDINRRAVIEALRENALRDRIHVAPFAFESGETYLFAVMDDEYDAISLLEQVGDDLSMREPGARMDVSDEGVQCLPPRGRDAEVYFALLVVIGCSLGLLFALSGFRSGGLGLLLTTAVCVALLQTSWPFPLGLPVQEASALNPPDFNQR